MVVSLHHTSLRKGSLHESILMKLVYQEDYRYVQSQLHHAHTKIRNILKSFINIRSIKDFRQVNDIYRISRSIHTSIKQRPAMFLKLKAFSILIWIMHLT